jgi:hypothetical protein
MVAEYGLGVLTLAFFDPLKAPHCVDEHYSIIKSDECADRAYGEDKHRYDDDLFITSEHGRKD